MPVVGLSSCQLGEIEENLDSDRALEDDNFDKLMTRNVPGFMKSGGLGSREGVMRRSRAAQSFGPSTVVSQTNNEQSIAGSGWTLPHSLAVFANQSWQGGVESIECPFWGPTIVCRRIAERDANVDVKTPDFGLAQCSF